jgi:hypothetical protein
MEHEKQLSLKFSSDFTPLNDVPEVPSTQGSDGGEGRGTVLVFRQHYKPAADKSADAPDLLDRVLRRVRLF